MSSHQPFARQMSDELCLAIRQILVNPISYCDGNISATNFGNDMDSVRQDFYGNGQIAGDSEPTSSYVPNAIKENRYAKPPPPLIAPAAAATSTMMSKSTSYLYPKPGLVPPTRRPLGARNKTAAAAAASASNGTGSLSNVSVCGIYICDESAL